MKVNLKKSITKIMASIILLGTLTSPLLPFIATTEPVQAASNIASGTKIKDKLLEYEVINPYGGGNGTVRVLGLQDGKTASETLTIPKTVTVDGEDFDITTIGENAFTAKIMNVKKLILPEMLEYIETNAFKDAVNLEIIVFKGDVPTINDDNGNPFDNIHPTGVIYYDNDKYSEFEGDFRDLATYCGSGWTVEPMTENSGYGTGAYTVEFSGGDTVDTDDDGDIDEDDAVNGDAEENDILRIKSVPTFHFGKYKFSENNEVQSLDSEKITVEDRREHEIFGAKDGFSVFARVKDTTEDIGNGSIGVTEYTIAVDNSEESDTADVVGTDNRKGDSDYTGDEISILGQFGKIATGSKTIKNGDRASGNVKSKIKFDENSLKDYLSRFGTTPTTTRGEIEYVLTNSSDDKLPDLVPYKEETTAEIDPIVTQTDGAPVTARGQDVYFAPTTSDPTSNKYRVLQLASGFNGSNPVGMNWVADDDVTAKYALILAKTAINSVQYNNPGNSTAKYTGSKLEATINTWANNALSNTYEDGVYTDYAQEVNLQGAAQDTPNSSTLSEQAKYATIVADTTADTYAFAPSEYDVAYSYSGSTGSLLSNISAWSGVTTQEHSWLRSPRGGSSSAGKLDQNGGLGSAILYSGNYNCGDSLAARPAFWVKIN